MRRFELVLLAMLAAATGAIPATAGAEKAPPAAAEATLPLDEILRLYRAEAEAKPVREVPPVRASIVGYALSARILDQSLDVRAEIEVAVVGKGWVRVPILLRDDRTHVRALPTVKNATIALDQDAVVLLTRKPGRYRFELGFVRRAQAEGRGRSVALVPPEPTVAHMRLHHDEERFQLRSREGERGADGIELYPRAGRFELAWERREAAQERVRPVARAVEPVVTRAHASLVATLEGQRIVRVLYELRFTGRKPMALELPPGQTLKRVYQNGVPTAFEVEDGTLRVEVEPRDSGGEVGRLEVVLLGHEDTAHLSGQLRFRAPAASWPVNEFHAELRLPAVFNYTWSGGSLAPVDTLPAVRFTETLPEPGKHLRFRQVLVAAGSPDVSVDYTVDLEGHYFR